MQTDTHFWPYLAQFFLEWEMFQTKVVQKIKTHILCSVMFFVLICIGNQNTHFVFSNVFFICIGNQNIHFVFSNVFFVLICIENQNTHFVFSNFFLNQAVYEICNTYRLSTTTTGARMRLQVTSIQGVTGGTDQTSGGCSLC